MHETRTRYYIKNIKIFRDLKVGCKNENLDKSFKKEVT